MFMIVFPTKILRHLNYYCKDMTATTQIPSNNTPFPSTDTTMSPAQASGFIFKIITAIAGLLPQISSVHSTIAEGLEQIQPFLVLVRHLYLGKDRLFASFLHKKTRQIFRAKNHDIFPFLGITLLAGYRAKLQPDIYLRYNFVLHFILNNLSFLFIFHHYSFVVICFFLKIMPASDFSSPVKIFDNKIKNQVYGSRPCGRIRILTFPYRFIRF